MDSFNLVQSNLYIKVTQWNMIEDKDKVQKDKQRSTKHTYKTKDRVTRTPLKCGLYIQVKIICTIN
jgi:hypothetical protein